MRHEYERSTNRMGGREQFVRKFVEEQHCIHRFVRMLVLSPSDADDLFQEVSVTLFEKMDDFQDGANFRAWAYGIARNKVMNYRKTQRRNRLVFSQESLNAIANDEERFRGLLDERQIALEECLKKVSPYQNQLLVMRYDESESIPQIAERLDRSVAAIYKALERLHESLFDCVTKLLAQRDGTTT